MDPSKENNQKQAPQPKQKSKIIPIILIVLLLSTTCGAAFYYYTFSKKTAKNLSETETPDKQEEPIINESTVNKDLKDGDSSIELIKETKNSSDDSIKSTTIVTDPLTAAPGYKPADQSSAEQPETSNKTKQNTPFSEEKEAKVSICNDPVKQLDSFYTHLDKKPYMAAYQLSEPSKKHFSKLIKKLLSNPPQITRESDDLYTILKNTAHFFRISGKNNILMMKGILDNEKASLEQILSDYYMLVSNPECSTSSYGDVDKDALYEYACFFLNTMGGRLYLFRRDSLSRMVVTYYAILLVDEANIQNNNHHGISLRPVVDMLLNEMETTGSSLKKSETYLNKLYNLKEKYQ
jgi:hypothetical protein